VRTHHFCASINALQTTKPYSLSCSVPSRTNLIQNWVFFWKQSLSDISDTPRTKGYSGDGRAQTGPRISWHGGGLQIKRSMARDWNFTLPLATASHQPPLSSPATLPAAFTSLILGHLSLFSFFILCNLSYHYPSDETTTVEFKVISGDFSSLCERWVQQLHSRGG
jgi:hypothetical protein